MNKAKFVVVSIISIILTFGISFLLAYFQTVFMIQTNSYPYAGLCPPTTTPSSPATCSSDPLPCFKLLPGQNLDTPFYLQNTSLDPSKKRCLSFANGVENPATFNVCSISADKWKATSDGLLQHLTSGLYLSVKLDNNNTPKSLILADKGTAPQTWHIYDYNKGKIVNYDYGVCMGASHPFGDCGNDSDSATITGWTFSKSVN